MQRVITVHLGNIIPTEIQVLLNSMPDLVERLLSDMADLSRSEWMRLAGVKLRSTARTYKLGISEIQSAPGVREIVLAGFLPNAVEGGLESFDLRETLLYNPNAKNRKPILGKNNEFLGWYNTVPFRHGSWDKNSGDRGREHFMSMGEQFSRTQFPSRRSGGDLSASQAASFGRDLYKVAQRLKSQVIDQAGKVLARGESLSESQVLNVMGRHNIKNPLLRPHHKSSIYAGMIKERKKYQRATQSQYVTFRRISTRVTTKGSWIHPGIQARHLIDDVASYLEQEAPNFIDDILKEYT